MAIDKNSKSMLNPYAPGENFGLSADATLMNQGNTATNYNEVMGSCQRTSVTEMLLGKVTSTGSSGQENFPLGNNGANLGTSYDGTNQKNYGNGK